MSAVMTAADINAALADGTPADQLALGQAIDAAGYVNARNVGDAIVGDKVEGPATNVTVAVGAAGVLTGTYYYSLTFVTASGETAPWPGTAVGVSPNGQAVNLTAIPIGPAGVIARRIYRTKASNIDVKDYWLVAEIPNNTATTFTDNVPDASLTVPANWVPTNRGYLSDGLSKVAGFGGGSTFFGQNIAKINFGYANTAFGADAMASNINGLRNCAFGVFALTSLDTGRENTAIGVHSGQLLTRGTANTFIGYAAGWNANGTNGNVNAGNFNVAVGKEALYGQGVGLGSTNVAVGYRALWFIQAADNNIGIGPFAGKWSGASRKLYIDCFERANYADNQNFSIIHGGMETTPQAQELRFNAISRLGWNAATVAQLPAAATAWRGYRAYVTDASVAYSGANIGTTVVGGGTNVVPVFCNGSAWVIG